MSDETPENSRPVLRIVRGTPDEAELAALVAVVGALGAGGSEEVAPASRNGWIDRARDVRRTPAPGPGAWRAALR